VIDRPLNFACFSVLIKFYAQIWAVYQEAPSVTLPLSSLRAFLLDYRPENQTRPKRVGILCSDAGFNTIDLLHLQDTLSLEGRCPFEIVFFFSDNNDYRNYSNYFKGQSRYYEKVRPDLENFDVRETLLKRGIFSATLDIDDFYRSKGIPSKNDVNTPTSQRGEIRDQYYKEVEKIIGDFEKEKGAIDFFVNDTYLSIITGKLLDRRIINCHWGDLTKANGENRFFTGYHGVLKSMQYREQELYSTIHFVNHVVDGGRILFRSPPFHVDYQRDVKFGFPFAGMSNDEVVFYINDPQNRETSLLLEALYEAYLRLYVDSDMLSLATLAVSKDFLDARHIIERLSGKSVCEAEHPYILLE